MKSATKQLNETYDLFSAVDWKTATGDIHGSGYALVPRVLPKEICEQFIQNYDDPIYRKTVIMERHRFGFGEYKYFSYPLPVFVQTTRELIYPKLAPIANTWMERLNLDTRFPKAYNELQKLCHKNGQLKPTPLILK